MAERQLTEQEIAILQEQREAMTAVILVSSAFHGKLGKIQKNHEDLTDEDKETINDIREFFANMVRELMTTLGISKEDLKEILKAAAGGKNE